METLSLLHKYFHRFLSKPIPLNGDGNPMIAKIIKTIAEFSFQTYSPQRGWKR